ncbi:MAG: tripartite tricarboxylate transporter TctB family protein, partial [Corynebacterium sp.]|nr:tripartite tricarboxylate transporter TctB family protein [Corynebacterium sp.]
MADKKKLTVAELLARDKKARGEKGGKDDKRSRRHRRSLDEGGISVAELTGNLKKVEASPAEAKHTSVSIDEDAPVIRAPKAAEATDADSAKKSTDKPASQSAAKAAAKPAQTAKPAAAAAAQEAEKKNQPSADDTAVIQRVGKAKADDAKPAATKPAAEKSAADKAGADKATAAKADKGAKAAGAGAATAGAGTAATAAVPASKKAGVAKDAEETGNLPKVEDDEEWIEEEHEKLNPVSILLMVVAGILLAIVIFKGFEILWDSFPRLVVAILALCVTAIM